MVHLKIKLFLLMLISMMGIVANAETYINAVYYNLNSDSKTAEVVNGNEKYTGTVKIPEKVTYNRETYKVIRIANKAFSGCSGLTSVTIPNSVTSIGSYAFEGCSGLTSVSIPNSVTSINPYAFYGCSGLTSVTIPNSVTSIGSYAFYGCSGLTSVTIPNSVTSIESDAFSCCSGLTSITLPNSVTSIGSDAFHGCSGLTSVTLPNSVTSIGNYAFHGCKNLTSVISLLEEPINIRDNVFKEISANCNLFVPKGTRYKYINSSGWKDSFNSQFVFDITIKIINSISFTSPTEVLEYSASKKTLQLNPTISPSTISNNDLTWSSSDKDIATVSGSGLVTGKEYGTATITCSAVNQQGELVSASCRVIVYKAGLIYVGNIFYGLGPSGYAFVTNCAGGIPSDVNKERYEYSGTINVSSSVTYDGVNYPVKAIGTYAFYNQPELQAVQIPTSVLTFEPSAFEKSKNLARVLFLSKEVGLISVGERAFYECSKLNNVVLPNSTQRIDREGFRYCSSLSNITLSNSLNYINEYAFADCPVLNNVVLPESLKSIQNAAFNNDAALSSITFPAALEGVGASAFANCASLKEVTFNTTNYTMTIGGDAFKGSNAINKVKVAHLDSWVSINFSNPEANPASISHRLYNTEGTEFTDAVVPEGPSYVNNNVFYNCQNLKSVTLPSTIQIINDNIFYGCTSLTKVVSKATNPPYFVGVDDPTKMNNVFNAADLYVPDASVSSYSSDDWWKRFKKTRKMSDMQNQPGSIEPAYKVGDDITSLATAEWEGKTADYGGLANPAVERYTNAAPDETGDILTQTLTGLRNGTYKVQLEVAASFTPDRGFTCPTGNGLSVAFANEAQENLPVVERGWVSEGEQNTVTLTATVTDGTLKYGIKNLAPSGNWFVARVSSIVYVSGSGDEPNYKAGDANGDGSVNVFDVTAIVNYILGSPSGTFVSKAADVNNDGNVNVFDVTKVVNIILGVNAGAKMRGVIDMNEGSAVITSTGEKNKDLVVNDAERYVAMQFDVVVQENSTLQNVALNNTAGHSLAYRQVETNRYRVIAYSTQNSTFEPTEDALVSLSFSDGNKAEIENAQFITSKGHSIFMIVTDEATDIVEVEGSMDESAIYNMAGQYVGKDRKSLPKGIYICNGKKFVVQ